MTEKKRHLLPTQSRPPSGVLTAPLPPGLWPGLWVVATPIGNLEDFSARALLALKSASAILCEDTSRTSKLLSAFQISKSMLRLDAHASPDKIRATIERLRAGENLALVSDAGTPAVSDPGAALVAAAWREGIRVTPIPGVSAVTALLSVSGFSETEFTFRGFFPRKKSERLNEIEMIKHSETARVHVYFESPERLLETLEILAEQTEENECVVGKELTKLHERIFCGKSADILEAVRAETEREGKRGEWCFAIRQSMTAAREAHALEAVDKSSDWVKALHCLLDAQVSASEAARQVSQHFGAPKKVVYEQALKIFGKKNPEGG